MTDDDSSGRLWDDFDPDSRGHEPQSGPEPSDRDDSHTDSAASMGAAPRAERTDARAPSHEQSMDESRNAPGEQRSTRTAPTPPAHDLGEAVGESVTARGPSFDSDSSSPGTDDVETVLETIDAFGRMSTPSQVLVLGPADHSVTERIYRELLGSEQSTPQNVVLVVAYDSRTRFPSPFADVVTASGGDRAVIEVGGHALQNSVAPRSPADLVDVYEYVSSPKNLAKIGIMTTKILAECNRTTHSTVLAVHTLTSISRYTTAETLFQFLHTLRSQLESTEVMGLFHLNPLEIDSQTVEMIRTLFDVVVEVTPDGEIDVT